MESSVLKAKTPKGKARLQAIMDATFEIIVSDGLAAASQDAIAQQAAVTQSAVRHYFPTKESLLRAFFEEAINRLQSGLDSPAPASDADPLVELMRCVRLHFDAIMSVDRVFFFEASAYWSRDASLSELRYQWHLSLMSHYQDLLSAIHPSHSPQQNSDTAFQILTLTQGCWMTLNRHDANKGHRQAILDGIAQLAAQSHEQSGATTKV